MTSRSLRKAFQEAQHVLARLLAEEHALERIEHGAEMLCEALRSGGTIVVCGNGGSLCDAMHFAEELTGRFRADRPALAALALADPSHLTCVGNDYGFEQVFSRGVEALGRRGDALVVLSTSGNSENIVRAVDAARARGMRVLALLGKGGGRLAGRADVEIIVPGETSDRIQELHMLILHAWVEGIEAHLSATGWAIKR